MEIFVMRMSYIAVVAFEWKGTCAFSCERLGDLLMLIALSLTGDAKVDFVSE